MYDESENLRKKILEDAITEVVSTDEGMLLMGYIMALAGTKSPNRECDSHAAMAWREGARSVGLALEKLIDDIEDGVSSECWVEYHNYKKL